MIQSPSPSNSGSISNPLLGSALLPGAKMRNPVICAELRFYSCNKHSRLDIPGQRACPRLTQKADFYLKYQNLTWSKRYQLAGAAPALCRAPQPKYFRFPFVFSDANCRSPSAFHSRFMASRISSLEMCKHAQNKTDYNGMKAADRVGHQNTLGVLQ